MLAKLIVEKIPSLRWKAHELISKTVYPSAFGKFDSSSVIVSPMTLGGLENIFIGARNAIYEGIWLKAEPQGKIEIGSDNYIGHRVHIHAVGNVIIGNNIMLADSVAITTGEHDRIQHDIVWTKGDIVIKDNAFIGEKAIILGGVTIGEGATVGAGAVVTKDVPAGATVAGVPARIISSN